MEKYEPIIQFFKSIGSEHEANMYLRLFKKGDPTRFAVIQIDERASSAPALAIDLAYLSNLDLYPIVVHDAGKSRLKNILEANKHLVRAVSKQGGWAQGFTKGVFQISSDNKVTVDPKALRAAVKADRIPIVAPLAHSPSGRTQLLSAEEVAQALVLALEPKKYIMILPEEGIWNNSGRVVSLINVSPELAFTPALETFTKKGAAIAKKLGELLLLAHDSMMVEITSPQNLLRELFTIKGGGTLIKRASGVITAASYQEIDQRRLKELLETCFARPLKPDFFSGPVSCVFLERDYKGVAIARTWQDLVYLDKFAVKKETQGEGVGADIWDKLLEKYPSIFWRSRPSNPINDWYFQRCSGMQKLAEWFVWWINVPESQKPQVLEYAASLPASFQDSGRLTHHL